MKSEMKIGLLGCSPLPEPTQNLTNFAQLRTWSLLKFLQTHNYQVSSFLLSDTTDHGWNVYDKQTEDALQDFCSDLDLLITSGPFLPALMLDNIPQDLPLWLDWPSDPLADLHAKKQVSQTDISDHAIVHEIVHKAFDRADAIGVISKRQSLATLGQLLLLGREDIPISVVPIAYDFPFSCSPIKTIETQDILISGSMNTWLDLRKIVEMLHKENKRKIHITGGGVSHFPEGEQLITKLQQEFPELIYHGWLEEKELQRVLERCQYSTWLDQGEIEPLLGSRTRALFAIWHGLKIFGSTKTELAEFLAENQAMVEWNGNISVSKVFEKLYKIDPCHSQSICKQYFSPESVYSPILEWIKKPIKIKKQQQDYPFTENQQLRKTLREIYQSKTWRITNRLHKLFY